MEHILVNYRRLPRSLMHIARIERSKKLQNNYEILTHNSITHYLSCRQVFSKFFNTNLSIIIKKFTIILVDKYGICEEFF